MTRPVKFEIRDPEWARKLQEGLEEYMGSLYEALEEPETDENRKVLTKTESGVPFTASPTCEGREILAFVAPRVVKGYLDKKIGFAEVADDWDGNIIEVPVSPEKD